MTPVLDLDAVGVRIGAGPERLAGVDLHLLPGAVAGVAGPAGAGKTLLAEVAALARAPGRGRRRLFGAAADRPLPRDRELLRRRIGWAPAAPAWVAGLDAAGNAALPARVAGLDRTQAEARAAALLHELGADPRATRPPPGAARAVALARALVAEPDLVVADDLDGCGPALLAAFALLVGQAARRGAAVLLLARDERLLDGFAAAQAWRLAHGRLEPRR